MTALSEVEQDFINETLEILTDLCRSCSELKGGGRVDEARQAIERGLHTIKGNSPAFGFDEFGEITSILLDKVREGSAGGFDTAGANLAPLVLEFVTRSRQFLGLVRDGRTRPFFGGIFKSLRDQLQSESARESRRAPDRSAPGPGETAGSFRQAPAAAAADSELSLKEKLEAILAKAPPVQPNLEQLSKLAARRLRPRSERSIGDRRARARATGSGPGGESPTPAEADPEATRDWAELAPSGGSLAADVPAWPSEAPTREVRPSESSPSGASPREARPPETPHTEIEPSAIEPRPIRPTRVSTELPPIEPRPIHPTRASTELPPIEPTRGSSEIPEIQPFRAPSETAAPAVPDAGRDDSGAGTRISEIAALAFDALCARQAASVVRAYVDQDPDLGRQMARVSGFLESFCQWIRGQHLVSLRGLLEESVAEVQALARQRGLDVATSVDRTDVLVPPLLGQVAQGAINDLLRGLSLLWKGTDGRRSLALAVTRGSNGAEVRISGAGSPTALAARLRVYPVKHRLQEMGGDLLTHAPDRHLVLVIPDNMHPMEVCLIRSGTNEIGVPAHRVVGSRAVRGSDLTSSGPECRCVFENEKIPVLDLTENPLRADGDGAEERCLVVLRDDGQRHGLLVDDLLGRVEMLVRLSAGLYQESDIVGSCFSVSEPRTVPLLDFRAPREARAEEARP